MTPEEENVIEAAIRYEREKSNGELADGARALRCAVRNLSASRAPKPPMTKADAEWELRAFGGEEPRPLAGESWMSECDFLLAARALESAAWDRALETVEAKAAKWDDGAHRGSYAWIGYVTALKGKCHAEAAP